MVNHQPASPRTQRPTSPNPICTPGPRISNSAPPRRFQSRWRRPRAARISSIDRCASVSTVTVTSVPRSLPPARRNAPVAAMCAARYVRGTRLNSTNTLMAIRVMLIRPGLDPSAPGRSLDREFIMYAMSVRLGSRVMRKIVRIVVRRSVRRLNGSRT
jgi:hypothetical protein